MTKTPTQMMEDLAARRDAIFAELAGMSTTSPGGLPNTSGTGDHVDHQGYKQGLYDELDRIDVLLEKLQFANGGQSQVRRGRLT